MLGPDWLGSWGHVTVLGQGSTELLGVLLLEVQGQQAGLSLQEPGQGDGDGGYGEGMSRSIWLWSRPSQ